jgi:hypothetical protein
VALDQIAFEDQGLKLGSGHHRFQVSHLTDEQAGFRTVVCALLKVRPNPIGEYCGFSDIQNLGLAVLEKVDAGAVRQMVELGL